MAQHTKGESEDRVVKSRTRWKYSSTLEKGKEVRVEFFLVRVGEPVRAARIDLSVASLMSLCET